MVAVAVARIHLWVRPTANILRKFLAALWLWYQEMSFTGHRPFLLWKARRVDLLLFVLFCGYVSHPGLEKVWKMG